MALAIGDEGATMGMTKEIYDKLNELLMPSVPPDNLADAQKGWKKLAFAISTGVVTHLLGSLEITGLAVGGAVTLGVAGNSASGNASLTQTPPTSGLVR